MKKNYFKQLSQETIIYGLSSIMSKFLMVFLVPIYTRIFLPEDYGVISIINTTMVFISIFIVMGLDSAAHRWYWDTDNENYRRKTISTWFWFQVFYSILFSLAFILFSKELSKILFHDEGKYLYFVIIALYFPFSITNTIMQNLFRMQRRAWACLWYSLIFSLLTICSNIILVVILKKGIAGVFYAQLITAILNTIFSIFLLKSWIIPKLFDISFLKKMLKYSLPLVPASLAYWVINLSGNYFINFLSDTKQVGLYQVGNSIASAIVLVTAAFQQAIGPFSLSIQKEENAKKIYADVMLFYVIIISFLNVFFNLFSYEILKLLTTKNYIDAHSIIPFLTFTYITVSLTYIAMIGCTIAKTTKPYAEATILSAIIALLLYFILIKHFGNIGAAVSSLISQFFAVSYIFYKSQKLYYIPYNFKNATLILLLSLTFSLVGGKISFNSYMLTLFFKLVIILVFLVIILFNNHTKQYLKNLMVGIQLREK